MPASKFTAARRADIIRGLRLGAPQSVAAQLAGVDKATMTRWMQAGEKAKPGTASRQFFEDVQRAKAEPQMRALEIVHDAMVDKPELAKWYVERQVAGYAPPQPNAHPVQAAPLTINLSFANPTTDALRAVPNEALEGEVIEPDDVADTP